MTMQPIEATNVPVEQPEVPRCENILCEIYLGPEATSRNGWCLEEDGFKSVELAVDWGRRTGKPFRVFRYSDSPPAAVDQAKVAEMWMEFAWNDNVRLASSVAVFVAKLAAKGVPRLEERKP
jgi:hypothetical protein